MEELHGAGPLARHMREQVVTILQSKGYTTDEIEGAISKVEEDRPLFNLFLTYILPILLKLLENLILAKRMTTNEPG